MTTGQFVESRRGRSQQDVSEDRTGSGESLHASLRATDGLAAQEAMLAPGGSPVQLTTAPGAPVQRQVAGGKSGLAAVQQKLADAGHDPGPIDGLMGPRTGAAIRAFQKENGLAVDGILGPQTLGALGLPGGSARGGGGARPGGGAAPAPGGGGSGHAGGDPGGTPAAPAPSGTAQAGTGASGTANVGADAAGGKQDGKSPGGGSEFEWGTKKGDGSLGLSDDGKSVVGQVGTGASYTVARNIYGPIYVAGSVGAKIVGAGSIGKETGGSIKVTVGAELRLGVGVGAMQGSQGFEVGAGGELKGQLEVVPVGISYDTQAGWKFDAFSGVVSVGINGYVMAQISGKGPKLTIPARKYDLYEVIGGRFADGRLSSFEARPGPGVAQLQADIAALLEQAKAKANKVADAVDEHAPDSVKDGAANVVSELIEGRSEDERKTDEKASAAATDASWENFRSWWHGHRAKLTSLGVPFEIRNQIHDLYVKAWNYANPGDSEVMPNHQAAASFRAQAAQLEQDAIKKVQQKQQQKQQEEKTEVWEAKKLKDEPLPPAIRGEVKHRVKNHQVSGQIPYAGVTYAFDYDKASQIIIVNSPGNKPKTVPYTPPWM